MTRQRKVPYLLALGMSLAILWGVVGLPALAEDAPATAAPAAAAAAAPDPTNVPAKADSTGASYTGANTAAALTGDKDAKTGKIKTTDATRDADIKNLKMALNIFWTLVTGFLVMFMQTGFAMLETGFCRSKNAAHTMAMNFVIYAIGLLGFWICGFALQCGGWGPVVSMDGPNILNQMFSFPLFGKTWEFLGHKGFFLTSEANDATVLTLFLFQMVFMDTAATIPTGAMAERWKFSAFCGHGHVDFAGSSVVHMTGGVCALAGAMILGPRIGKFNKDGSPNAIAAHNIPMAAVGTLILAFGWFGFNPGSSLAATDLRISAIAVNTMLASGAGCFTALLYMWALYGKPDPSMGCNGLLAGLVAITAPCAFVNPVGAVIIGTISGILVVWGVLFVERVLKVDDPVGAVAVHGVNGAWGCLSIGLLATGEYGDNWNSVPGTVTGLFYGGGFGQLAAEAIGVTTNFVWVFGMSFIFFKILDKTMGMRVSARTEIEGLDIHEMGVPGYSNEDTMAVQVAYQEHLNIFGPGVPKKTTEKEVVGTR